MSYDLYFYKQKADSLNKQSIAEYLTMNLTPEQHGQWFFENSDTGVYFSLDYNEPDPDQEVFQGYENTHFSFNLNFIRPSFFGLEAFEFVEKFCIDLRLSVLNPQSTKDEPYVPSKEELFERWNDTNLHVSKDYYDDSHHSYIPADKSNEVWLYNFNRNKLQSEVGESYFVPRIFFFRVRADNLVITVSMWPQHIPIILPQTDFYLLGRKYKRLFKNVDEKILVSNEELWRNLADHFETFSSNSLRRLKPGKTSELSKKFNSIKPSVDFKTFAEAIPTESLLNSKK